MVQQSRRRAFRSSRAQFTGDLFRPRYRHFQDLHLRTRNSTPDALRHGAPGRSFLRPLRPSQQRPLRYHQEEFNWRALHHFQPTLRSGSDLHQKRFHQTVSKDVGFNANDLCLWSIDQEMPKGTFVRRRLAYNFKPQKRDKYTLMYDWMDHLNHSQGLHIQHKLNTGKEKKISPYLVDSYDANTNTVY